MKTLLVVSNQSTFISALRGAAVALDAIVVVATDADGALDRLYRLSVCDAVVVDDRIVDAKVFAERVRRDLRFEGLPVVRAPRTNDDGGARTLGTPVWNLFLRAVDDACRAQHRMSTPMSARIEAAVTSPPSLVAPQPPMKMH